MYLELNNKKYFLYSNFEKKISELRKKDLLNVDINFYIDTEEHSDMIFFESLYDLPNFLYFTNNYYWWIFEGVFLEKKSTTEDKNYFELVSLFHQSKQNRLQNERKFITSLTFSYKQVWGTNKRKSVDRDLILRDIRG